MVATQRHCHAATAGKRGVQLERPTAKLHGDDNATGAGADDDANSNPASGRLGSSAVDTATATVKSNRWQLCRWVDFTAARLYVCGNIGGDDLAKTSGPVLFVEQMDARHQFPELLHAMERGPCLVVFRTRQPGLRALAEHHGAAGVEDDDGFTRYVGKLTSAFVERLRRICGDRWAQRQSETISGNSGNIPISGNSLLINRGQPQKSANKSSMFAGKR